MTEDHHLPDGWKAYRDYQEEMADRGRNSINLRKADPRPPQKRRRKQGRGQPPMPGSVARIVGEIPS
jgi:hypothetical protein